MSNETIYKQLVAGGLSPAGACGVMGNMSAESAMRANNAQDGTTNKTDEQYTEWANGNRNLFATDAVGYGLCQWTYRTRKAALWDMCNASMVGVDNEATQVAFCLHELKTEYAELYKYLCTTVDEGEAAVRVCKEYERPAINNTAVRIQAATKFYKEFALIKSSELIDNLIKPDQSIMILQAVLKYNCYWDKPCDGVWSKAFADKLVEFAGDVAGQGG